MTPHGDIQPPPLRRVNLGAEWDLDNAEVQMLVEIRIAKMMVFA